MVQPDPIPLVLASSSRTRAQMLANAGIPVVCRPSGVDEDVIKERARGRGDPPEAVAMALAEAKALAVSAEDPRTLVIGADQLMVCGDLWLGKPLTRDGVRATLTTLRGQQHRLISGVAVVRAGAIVWRHLDVAHLSMRPYSDRFIDWYVDRADDADLQSVGACRLEGPGVQAFAHISGDSFTILGLPLLPLLEFLRQEQVLVE